MARAAKTTAKSEPSAEAPTARDGEDQPPAAPITTGTLTGTPPPSTEATPSMAQFLEIKAANPDSILWYRMGDFYELFFEDAVVASEALSIVLTKRGKHLGQDIPMCGVPVVRADEYLQRLIKRGFRVAVCEQLEDPAEARKRGSKAVVRRDVVRLVTPGTLTEEALLDAKARNYLSAIAVLPAEDGRPAPYAIASLDISSGDFEVGTVPAADLAGELVRLSPGEVIGTDAALSSAHVKAALGMTAAAATPQPATIFDSLGGERALKERLGVMDLAAFGEFSRGELAAIAGLLRYVDLTQLGHRPLIRAPRKVGPGAILVIDASSRASLELVRSTSGGKAGSLLGAIDRTVTAPGARELQARLASPVSDARTIQARLDAVAFLVERDGLREELRDLLRRLPDLARAASRLLLQRGGPRDLGQVRDALAGARDARAALGTAAVKMGLPADLADTAARLDQSPVELYAALAAALVDEPSGLRREGGFTRAGFKPELDEARRLRDDSRRVILALEAKYIEATGVKSLKVRHNNLLGFFIEVTQLNAKPLQTEPHADVFRHRQTMSNAMRFSTEELVDLEGRMASAAERALALEQEVFNDLSKRVADEQARLGGIAGALAELDVIAGLAEVAAEQNFVRPTVDHSRAFVIEGGRHPVVEQALKSGGSGLFIENDCVLGRPAESYAPAPSKASGPGFDEPASARLWIVTGPNMAGKSTFLRQNALITVLAQMGSFVPARRAHIGIVDRLFSRVGAADDIARGRSTFMVEMVETAGILNQATERSLVILDEIGRGTATFDGLSIAWATVEHLHGRIGCRALFATHYHELTALAGRLGDIANVTMDVKEWQDEIVFLHRVKPGAGNRSYGIQVAKLAGLPAAVTKRAAEVLKRLEKSDRRNPGPEGALGDLPLFAAQAAPAEAPRASEIEAALAAINPDDLTPKAALDALYKLKELERADAKAGKRG